MKAPKPKKTFIQMTFLLSLAAFLVFAVMFSIMYVLFRYALKINLNEIYKSMDINNRVLVIILFITSFIVGYALSLLYTHTIISPIHKVIKSMDEFVNDNMSFNQQMSLNEMSQVNLNEKGLDKKISTKMPMSYR